MSNFVTNQIVLIGNEAIKNLAIEINRRFSIDWAKTGIDKTAVGRILYGLKGNSSLLRSSISATSVFCEAPLGPLDSLRLISERYPIREVQDHILRHASKLDPKLIVYMEYREEYPRFVGARYALIKDSEIKAYEENIDTYGYTVVTEEEVDDIRNEFKADGDDPSTVITWEDISAILWNAREKEFANMCRENKGINESALKFYF